MGLPKSSLTEDEEIVLDFHPHWTTLLAEGFLLVVIVAVAGVLIWLVPDGEIATSVRLGLIGIALIAGFIFVFIPFLRWFTTSYVLTNRRFVLRQGVLSRHGRDIPLARIHDVAFSHNLIERMLGTGTLAVESGGERGQMTLRNIPQVEHVQAEMYRLIEDFSDGDGERP